MKSAENMNEPWEKPWLADGLESIIHCPVCTETDRKMLHSDLVDNVFRVAQGKWTLWQCANCNCAYLDPRPTSQSIYLAYANYYTHQEALAKDDYVSLSQFRKLRRRLVNGYTNSRYSTHAVPSSVFWSLATFVMPNLKKIIDRQYRHMPRLPASGGVLLDVGCGNGAFLSLASTCGWSVVGLDFDPKAIANASKQGLNVFEGGIDYFEGKYELFDVITLNHVIEHVHKPVKMLKTCYALLKPGGQLWLETPNIDSLGHARFQKNWRGLEAPRHLIIFNRHSLTQAFVSAGFPAPHDLPRPSATGFTFKESFALLHGYSPYQARITSKALQWQAFKTACMEAFLPSRREFLCVVTNKQKS